MFFLLEIFNNIIQYQFDGMTLSIISWITYQFLCMSSWRTDTFMMFVVCSRDLSFLPLRLGGMQVNDLNNSWLSRQTYILLQMSQEIVLFFQGNVIWKAVNLCTNFFLSLYRNFQEQNLPISLALFLYNTVPSTLVKIYEKSHNKKITDICILNVSYNFF